MTNCRKQYSKSANIRMNCIRMLTVLLELGAGFNTPTIIRFPFEKLMREHKNLTLIRLNLDEAMVPAEFGSRAVGINADMKKVSGTRCRR